MVWCLHILMHVYTNTLGHIPGTVCYSVLYLVKPQVFLSLTQALPLSTMARMSTLPAGSVSAESR